ncbi:putative GMC oxidoreductase [Daldinia grandis]|nr:putative GMC oxidoreductase [Daldinia grandis]
MASGSFDFIVVGGGLAGLVLASRLSEDPAVQVLVIEAGEDQTADPRVNVPAMWPTLLNTPSAYSLRTVPQKGLDNREIWFPLGRLLGGSSALNGLAFSITSKANVDAWEALGNPGWGWSSFSESFKKSYSLPSEGTDAKGPVQLAVPDEDTEWPRVWRETLVALGFPVTDDPFSGQLSGGLTVTDSLHPATKQRSYAGNAYLEAARPRSNLTIWTKALTEKIIFDKSDIPVATGVQVNKDGETKIVGAHKEVIISAGTVNSPKILELSGIGDAQLLQSLGIDVVVDTPNVGENLQNHPLITLSFETRGQAGFETIDQIARQDQAALGAAMEAYSKQKGPFAKSNSNIAAQLPFPGVTNEQGKQELEKVLQSASSAVPDKPTSLAEAHESFVRSILASPTEASGCYLAIPGYAGFGGDGRMAGPPPGDESWLSFVLLLAHPLSRGSVHITKASADSPALAIDPKYFSHPLDLEVFARHLQFVEKFAQTEPLASALKLDGRRTPTAPPLGSFADLDKVKEYIHKTAVGAHHFTGTCAMAPRELGGVVDAQLRVYGTRNLRVCDASIVPITPRTNPQATVYGVAEHGAQIIKGTS